MVEKNYNPQFYTNNELKDKSGIYQIRNLINEKIYIGSAKSLPKRKNIHFCELKNGKHHSVKLQRAFNKYGEENFVFEVIEFVEDKSKLLECEQYWIDRFNSSKEGYNINPCAENRLGVILSDETKQKLSKSHKGIHSGEKNPMFGKRHTKETRIKMSNNRKPMTEEQRKKLSELASSRTGELNPFFGKKHTEESKQKMREFRSVPIVKIYPIYEYYSSSVEAGIKNNISSTSVYNSCENNKFTKGMKFMRYKDYLNQDNIDI